ncbi:helix-turn-helix transcriptional regulator [Glycomyces salinus]|uniref:helix-turn-helix transcriptional regulator n=1 Tax=Glycomyces salinus TaxID=980294 RepID=UPI0018EC3CFA|nr:LuxR C-terminal-related transcriptional regulator [Glycomyces salinus]
MRPQEHATVLAQTRDLLEAPLPEILPRVSAIAGAVLPHRGLLLQSGDCVSVPVRSHGDAPDCPETVAEMARLAGLVEPGRPWHGEISVAGAVLPVVAVASAPPGSAGSVLAALPTEPSPDEAAGDVLQRLWDLAAAHVMILNAQVEPVKLSRSHVESGDRARLILELTDAHAATLGGVLGALRSGQLSDAAARRTAADIAAAAMVDLRSATGRERHGGAETAGTAFARMTDKLVLLMRYNDAELELDPPERADQVLPGEVAAAARALVRGAVLTALDQAGIDRIRISWDLSDGALRVTVRDDGPGVLAETDTGVRRIATAAAALGAQFDLDAVPGWGTTVTARIPLGGAAPRAADLAERLNPREIDVLHHLVGGHRNRRIAEVLHISEHTVKFHVANILEKLDVASRGEAAAVARELGFVAPARPESRGS